MYVVRAILKLVKLGYGSFKVLTMFQDTVFITHNLNIFTYKLDFYVIVSMSAPLSLGKTLLGPSLYSDCPPPCAHSFIYTAAELTEKVCGFKTLQWILTVFRIKSKIFNRTQKAGMIWPLATLTGAF